MEEPKNQEVLDNQDVIEENPEISEATEEKVESRETVIDKIKEKINKFFSKDSEEEEESKEVELPADFTKAVHGLGWKEEDIAEFAKDYSADELEEMIPFLVGEDSDIESDDLSREDDEEDTEVDGQKTDKKKGEDSQEDERIQKLLDRIEALEKAQGKSQEAAQQQETVNLVNRASQMFDEASEEFEVFGKTDDLPKFPDGRIIPTSPQVKARSKVWEMAYRLKDTGLDFDQAMSIALNAFKGENLAKDIHRKVIKDLKSKEKRLGGKRTSHESSSTAISGVDVIREVARKHGRDIL